MTHLIPVADSATNLASALARIAKIFQIGPTFLTNTLFAVVTFVIHVTFGFAKSAVEGHFGWLLMLYFVQFPSENFEKMKFNFLQSSTADGQPRGKIRTPQEPPPRFHFPEKMGSPSRRVLIFPRGWPFSVCHFVKYVSNI
jgi:hypothetical protein